MRVERVFSMVLFFPELCSRSDSNQGGTGGTGDESFPFPSAARVKSGGLRLLLLLASSCITCVYTTLFMPASSLAQ
jgi:hypothetical protein